MRIHHLALTAVLASLLAPAAFAQSTPPDQKAPNEQVINPEIDRRDVRMPKFPSNDFEIGVFVGSYATQNFGTSVVGGLRAGYHITEDIFVEGVLAQTKVSDEDFRNILPSGIFTSPKQKLSYYNLSVGWNVLPGEVFIGSKRAKASALYLIAGVGSTRFVEQRRQTFNVGLGNRLFLTDKMSLQVDLRDHIFSLDLLGQRKNTQNIELSAGFSYFF
jgi:outer membrane beta-barrel protein